MISTSKSNTILDVLTMMLEKQNFNISYQNGTKSLSLNGRHLFDLFIAGLPAEQTLSSLLELSPAIYNSQNPAHLLFQNSLRYFISIFDSLHDGVLIADKNEIVRYINTSFERISGARFNSIVGQKLSLARPGAKLGGVISSQKAMLGVKRRFGDIEYITDMHPIFINGDCIGGITVARDITEIEQLQLKLSKYRIRYNHLLRQVNKENSAVYTFNDIIGTSAKILAVKDLAKKIAYSDMPVLIRGESGTGKELFAHAIHLASKRANQPFITVNCAAIPEPLLESELFGYKEGAFSGAKQDGKQGLITLAHGGTLFLDEIGDMNIELQAKILRVLQFGDVQPLGSEKSFRVDVRVIAATNCNLEKKIVQAKFREDLFYRLNVSQIVVPPLRERKEDIMIMADYFLNKLFVDHPLAPLRISERTREILSLFPWPGNVRELENTINFLGNITTSKEISSQCLPPIFYEVKSEVVSFEQPAYINAVGKDNLKQLKQAQEKKVILKALDKNGRSVQGKKLTAKELGISLTTLYSKLAILGIK